MKKKLFHYIVAAYCIITTILLVVILCTNLSNNTIFNRGYNKAIHDAQLVEITEDTYYIQFGDSIHEYTFE